MRRKRQINYQVHPLQELFRGRPLIRGFNENKLYHRLYTIYLSNLCSAKLSLVIAQEPLCFCGGKKTRVHYVCLVFV